MDNGEADGREKGVRFSYHIGGRALPGEDDLLWCSFCGKHRRYVKWLVGGGTKEYPAYLCDECLETITMIVEEKEDEQQRQEAKGKQSNGNGHKETEGSDAG
jgi:hypothetical protein